MKKPFEGISQDQIMCALIGQVSRAANGDTEQNVTTFITRPLWRAWNIATGVNPDDEPTSWNGSKNTRRVFGSRTIVVESEELWSVSKKHV